MNLSTTDISPSIYEFLKPHPTFNYIEIYNTNAQPDRLKGIFTFLTSESTHLNLHSLPTIQPFIDSNPLHDNFVYKA